MLHPLQAGELHGNKALRDPNFSIERLKCAVTSRCGDFFCLRYNQWPLHRKITRLQGSRLDLGCAIVQFIFLTFTPKWVIVWSINFSGIRAI